jgi:outer membrane autotransporter protein
MKKTAFLILVLSVCCSPSFQVFADDNIWNGNAHDSNWGTAGNWSSGLPDLDWPNVVFSSTGAGYNDITLGDAEAHGIWFDAPGVSYTLGSSADTLTLADNGPGIGGTGDIQMNPNVGSYDQTIAANVRMTSNLELINLNTGTGVLNITGNITNVGSAGTLILGYDGIDNNTGDNTISGQISDGSAEVAVNVVAGKWVLSGNNSYTGATTIEKGILSVRNADALGSTANGTSVADDATLDLNGTFAVGDEAITLAEGSTLSSSSGANSISGLIQVTGTSTVNVASSFTLSGSVVGSTGAGFQILDKTGAGTLTLGGGSDNTSLATTVDAGTLVLAKVVTGDPGITATSRVVVNGGTLRLAGDENRQIWDAASVTLNGGTFDENGMNETIGTLVLNGGAISGSGILTINSGAIDARSGSSSTVLAGTQGLAKTTAGTVTLSAANTFTGKTVINGGTLVITDDSGLGAAPGSFVADQLSFNNNAKLETSADMTLSSLRGITLTGAGTVLTDPGTTLTYDGIIAGSGSFTKEGTGTLSLGGANAYTGITNIIGGTLSVGNAVGLGLNANVNVGASGTLDINNVTVAQNITLLGGSLTGTGTEASLSGDITLGGNSVLGGTGTLALGGVISGNLQAITKTGSGTVILSGHNTYTGGTTINAGTLRVSNANAVGTGALTNNAVLDVGTTNLSVSGVYTQSAGSTLGLTADSVSSFGNIVSVSDAVVASGSAVAVTVRGYMPNGFTFKVIDGAGGAGVNVPATITSSNPKYTFIGSSSSGDLILTVNRTGSGFESGGRSPNGKEVGKVLDDVVDPTGDMMGILDSLDNMSDTDVGAALDTLSPVVDSGVTNVSNTAIVQFVGASEDRLAGLFARAHNEETGVSTGSEGLKGFEAWGRGFGEYARQDPRGLSNGYHATIWGTAIGGDLPVFNDRVRLGLSGGYAASDINSKDNGGSTDIDSYQGALYGGYMDPEKPYYINGAFSFAFNNYKGSRNIAVGTIMRTANADYDGRQYSVLLDGGYIFKAGKKLRITPIASLQYLRLHLDGYTETNAGALNLAVNSQNYDMLQSGLGMKLDRSFELSFGTLTPEVHARWLHDFISDSQETTSTFAGGGGSFATNGFTPARNGLNAGGRLALVTKGNWSLDANYDFEFKEDFTSHTGWANIRYSF